jgi:hypothetical protein
MLCFEGKHNSNPTGGKIIMAKQSKPDETQPTRTTAPAEQVEPPAQWYTRGSKPNPYEDDVRQANENQGTWFRIVEGGPKAAKQVADQVRRAGTVLGVKLSVRLPATEPGSVYFSAKVPEAEPAAQADEGTA